MGKKKNSYSFLVHEEYDYAGRSKKRGQIDVIRISKEVREDKPNSVGFVLSLDNNNESVVCLYRDFLYKFNSNDAPEVLGEALSPDWGIPSLPILNKVLSLETPQTFRALICRKSDIESVRKDINAAKETLNKLQVTVKIL